MNLSKIDRREFMVTSFALGGGLALSLVFPRSQAAAASPTARIAGTPWETLAGKEAVEIDPWLVIEPDDTVTIRVAQSEMGQATFTSWAKMIVEELECDWSKVRAEYASVNRHFRENKVYRRMTTNSSSSVRVSRTYLQQAGASARERLIAAAAGQWRGPRPEVAAQARGVTPTPTRPVPPCGPVRPKAPFHSLTPGAAPQTAAP